MSSLVYIETKGNATFVSMKSLSERYELCMNTVRDRKKGIEEEIISGRYPSNSIINDGNLVLINEMVFLDYLSNRKLLKSKTTRKYAKPFNPTDWVEMLGFYNRPVKVES